MTAYYGNDYDGQTPPPPGGAPVYPDAGYGVDPGYQQGYAQQYYYDAPPQQVYYVQSPVQPASPQRPRGGMSTGAIIGVAIIAAIALVLMVSVVSCTTAIGSMTSTFGLASTATAPSDDSPKVAVIAIDGTIQYDGTENSPSGLRSLLEEAEDDDSIKAVVLRVNSGGGVATAGEEMAYYLKEFSKPVVVSSAATNASAAYEISSQADYIFTAKTTSIGSIGVAFQVTDLSGLYEKLGIKIENITSADSKDATYGDRPLTDEERAWYQGIVDQIDDDFVTTVAEGRKMDVDAVRELANGLAYTGADAVEVGLADEVGYYEDAVAKASELAGFNEPLDTYRLSISSSSNLSALLDVLSQETTGASDDAALEALESKYGRIGEDG